MIKIIYNYRGMELRKTIIINTIGINKKNLPFSIKHRYRNTDMKKRNQ